MSSNSPNVNTINEPYRIRRRVRRFKPRTSMLAYELVPTTINSKVEGIRYKRFPGQWWGNSLYEATNGMIFDNYYDAENTQALVNAGYCDSKILELLPKRPVYYIPQTDTDVVGYRKEAPYYYKPRSMWNNIGYQKLPSDLLPQDRILPPGFVQKKID